MINSVKISEKDLKALLRGERVTIPIICGFSVEGEIGKTTVTTHINLEIERRKKGQTIGASFA